MRALYLLLLCAALLVGGCSSADYRIATAPGPSTFAELAEVVQFGDPIRIEMMDGSRVDGMVVRVTPDELQIDPAEGDFSGYLILHPDQVDSVRIRDGHPVLAICGAAVGAGVLVYGVMVNTSSTEPR